MSSEPYIKVWAQDMRGDDKAQMLTLSEQMVLVHAWDLAKNGAGECDELRCADGAPHTAATLAALIPQLGRPAARRWFERVVAYGLAVTTDDGALRFPALVRRQAIDRTNAERQRRFRQRHRDGSRNGSVPGQSYSDKPEDPLTPAERGDQESKNRRADGSSPRSQGTSPRQVAERSAEVERGQRRLASAVEQYRSLAADDERAAEAWLQERPAELRDAVLAAGAAA